MHDDDDRRVLIVPTNVVPAQPARRDPLCTSCGTRVLPSGLCGCNAR